MSSDRGSRDPAKMSRLGVYVRAFLREPVTVFAWIMLIFIALAAIFGPELYPHDPYSQSLAMRNQPPGTPAQDPSLPPHFLGTDPLGRDVVVRLLVGARVSMSIGVAGVVVSGLLGVAIGVSAGYFRGRIEDILMRLTDVQLSFPALIMALFVLFAIGPGFVNLILVMAVVRWPAYARVARSLTLGLSGEQYMDAAKILGSSHLRTLREHVIPNVRSPLIIVATLELGRMILYESTLSFLGFGIQPPDTSWGLMIAEGRVYMNSAPWMILAPGFCILAAALSANIIAGWGQNVTDPVRRAQWLRGGLRRKDL